MAEGKENENFQQEANEKEEKLKYLEFVQATTDDAVTSLSNIYLYAKDNSGPLKPGVETIEGVAKTVVIPASKIPTEAIKFADRAMDASFTTLQNIVPSVLKQLSTQACDTSVKESAE
ncbi:hypothetical protein P3X46_034718 [Hevea brasiliensis]|uniref:Uncharacterized protein n=1 Tax=Hevea brasiliensis TaxID=3981 RepID=A0ABQ9K7M1_HEVBR|nr:small rubber particle protein-like [Hevea brasiliensis]KAJ9128592.1 hypothetical protein P3X46_034718 [Hevea brasiliensis]